ncbi:MAG TPA: cation:proton antiporter, partial [Chloroflexota bacterium]|nr:cation:proton antiporter [Chloroflexota bacterium]
GLVLGAYAAGVIAGGSGFLSAYAGGLAVTLLNNELCDCFMDYGEVTAEMAMLLTFVLMGSVLSGILGTIAIGPALLFAVLVIGVARPLAISVVLHGSPISREAQTFIAWFGPRGLSSLLFALLALIEGVPGGEILLATVGVVVIVSVVLHGATATPMVNWYVGRLAASTLVEERDGEVLGAVDRDTARVPRIDPEELATKMLETPSPIVLDVRSRSDYAHDRSHIPGSVRVLPDMVTVWAARQPKEREVVAYCT